MIPRSHTERQPAEWQRTLQQSVKSGAELLSLLGLDGSKMNFSTPEKFPLRVPRRFVERMTPGDPLDPLLLQVLPRNQVGKSGWLTDPVGDLACRAGEGIIHKYHGRVLLVGTGACAIHCRYCFRQHFPYTEELASRHQWSRAVQYVAEHADVSEVILSGGDPLLLSTEKLAALTDALLNIAHVRRLRIHTRVPVVLPERIDASLLQWLADSPLQKVMVLHVNHSREMDEDGQRVIGHLRDAGVTMLNQAVLLAGVNDSVAAQCALSERLFECGALPYYLHFLDRVAGAEAFEVEQSDALEMMNGLRTRLPGYLVPRLVHEQAGAAYKLPLL